MKELKSLIRKHERPLEQLVNRYSEKNSVIIEEIFSKSFDKNKLLYAEKPILKQEHTEGLFNKNLVGSQYKSLFFKHLKIKIKEEVDCFVLIKNKIIVKCLNIIVNDKN
jgi:hypothetical protein